MKGQIMGKKLIKVMDTSFRDGFQSVYGARVFVEDFLPALKSAVDAGIRHFEVAGGARFQSPIFYCNENAFETMDKIRAAVGPDVNLQSLARGVNVVGLDSQPRDMINLHAKMFKKHGVTDPHTLWAEKKWNWDTFSTPRRPSLPAWSGTTTARGTCSGWQSWRRF